MRLTDKYTIPSNTGALKQTLPVLLAAVRATHPAISDAEYRAIRLIYTELIVNAIVHGNRCDAQKQVHIAVCCNSHGLFSVVADEGLGFDYQAFLCGNKDPLSESGRGLLLVRSLTDWLAFNRKGNGIVFFKKIISLPSTCALS